MVPTDRESFKNWCLRALGHPVVLINVDDEQVDDRVDEALRFWQQFHFDGSERTYIAYEIDQTDIDNKYLTIAENVWGITRVFPFSSGMSSGDGLFDIKYQMMHNDIFGLRGSAMIQGNLQYYVMTQQYLSLINMILVGETPIRFNRHTDRLHIDWDWGSKLQVGDFVMVEAFQVLDPATYSDIWSDDLLAELCIAMILRQWGTNMSKYGTVQLLGGVTMNGLELKAEAINSVMEVKQRIRDMYEAPPMMQMG
jgi:hypothetical protein